MKGDKDGDKDEFAKGDNDELVQGDKNGLVDGDKDGFIKGENDGLVEGDKDELVEGVKDGLVEGDMKLSWWDYVLSTRFDVSKIAKSHKMPNINNWATCNPKMCSENHACLHVGDDKA